MEFGYFEINSFDLNLWGCEHLSSSSPSFLCCSPSSPFSSSSFCFSSSPSFFLHSPARTAWLALEMEDPELDSRLHCGDFFWSSHTCDLKLVL